MWAQVSITPDAISVIARNRPAVAISMSNVLRLIAVLLDASGVFGLACLLVIWTLTLTAAAIHLAWMSAPELLVGATFVGLGWAGGLALPWTWIHAGVVPGVLMLVGGLLYTAGALSCRRRTASW
jgi:channel protein (hemolysin III family)